MAANFAKLPKLQTGLPAAFCYCSEPPPISRQRVYAVNCRYSMTPDNTGQAVYKRPRC